MKTSGDRLAAAGGSDLPHPAEFLHHRSPAFSPRMRRGVSERWRPPAYRSSAWHKWRKSRCRLIPASPVRNASEVIWRGLQTEFGAPAHSHQPAEWDPTKGRRRSVSLGDTLTRVSFADRTSKHVENLSVQTETPSRQNGGGGSAGPRNGTECRRSGQSCQSHGPAGWASFWQ